MQITPSGGSVLGANQQPTTYRGKSVRGFSVRWQADPKVLKKWIKRRAEEERKRSVIQDMWPKK